jgi:Fe-S oxidoreductase
MAISGQLGPDAFASDGVLETLSLCVSCKGCRRECPTGVDIARMKIEVLHARAQQHGLSWRDRLVAYLPRYAPYGARLSPLLNLRDRLPGAAAVSERLFGFSAGGRCRAGAATATARLPPAGGRDVVLLADTFNRYFEPENLRSAHAVLSAAGYRVIEPTPARRAAAVLRAHVPRRRPRRRGPP